MIDLWPWLGLFGLGAYHGINPGMGWLFAVSLGLQEKSRRALLAALPPVALGHALSIGAIVVPLWLAQASVPVKTLRYFAATILFCFGLYRLLRSRHLKWVGMRVGFRDLTLWSFLTASAHGAGLMLVPILLGWAQQNHTGATTALEHVSHAGHISPQQMPVLAGPLRWLMAVGVHTTGHLLVATLIALLIYEKLGLAILRHAWFNLDLIWVIALMLSSALVLIL
jgi:hypothetical protein